MSAQADDILTFGFEFEFLTQHEAPGQEEPRDSSFAVPKYFETRLAKSLADLTGEETKIPIAVLCTLHFPHESCYNCEGQPRERIVPVEGNRAASSLVVYSDANLRLIPPLPYDTSFFMVHEEMLDEHRLGDEDERWWGEGTEVATAVQTSQDLTRGLPQLRSFITGLQTIDLPIGVNRSCGFHVHAGYLGGMTLLNAKKVTTLVMLLESGLLRALCTSYRHHSVYTRPVAGNSRLYPYQASTTLGASSIVFKRPTYADRATSSLTDNLQAREFVPESVARLQPNKWLGDTRGSSDFIKALEIVWDSPHLLDLSRGLWDHFDQRCGFVIRTRLANPRGLDPNGVDGMYKDVSSTFEFRYLQMTFDVDMVQRWTMIISAILQVSAGPSDLYKDLLDAIVNILHSGEDQGKQTVWRELLNNLGLAHDIPFWEAQLENYERGEEFSLTEGGILQKIPVKK